MKMNDIGLNPWDKPRKSDDSPLASQVGGDHYKDMKIQPVTFITENGLGFLEGCIVKRICRYQSKNGIEDLDKIIHEVKLLKELKYGC